MKVTTAPTPGTGSVTISGSERTKTINACPPHSCPITIYDSGTVSITVNGVANSVSYGQGSTASNIASALASAINSNTNSSVTATVSNTTVSLTAKVGGSASDYSLSAGAATNDSTYFPSGSFAATAFGFNLVGGCNAVGSFTMANGVGRRTGICDAAGGEALAYDPMGHEITDLRNTNGISKTTSYQYTLDGSLSKLTYPTGRVVNYAY